MSLEVELFKKTGRCDDCMNSRLIISENGYHTICTLSQGKACNCIMGRADHFKKKINFKNESGFYNGG